MAHRHCNFFSFTSGIAMHIITRKSPLSTAQRRSCQRGDFLLEALIGMVLMAIISMGVVYVTSKASVSQRDMQVQEIAIKQLRTRLQAGVNVCAANQTINLPDGTTPAVTTQGCAAGAPAVLTATIQGVAVQVPSPVVMSANIGPAGCQTCNVVVGGSWR